MPRTVSCRRCGKPGRTSLCSDCRADTYGSNEYKINSQVIRAAAKQHREYGGLIHCIICEHIITGDFTIEHRIGVMHGGSNNLNNLGPAHARCNYGQHSGH